MSRRNLWMIFAVSVVSLVCYSRASRNPYGRYFAQAMDTIESQYIEAVDREKLFEGAMRGMVGRLDDYSSFLPSNLKTYFDETLDQKYGGIGIEISPEGPEKHLVVMSARIGGPAYKAGVHAGDRIVGIDNQSAEAFTTSDASRLLRGTPGTPVALRVRREGYVEPLEFHMTRALIQVDSVLGDVRQPDGSWNFFLPGQDKIGYIRINSFGELTLEEFQAAMHWLSERGCRGLILDLRNNPGGLLESAQQICDMFIPAHALIVTTRGRDAVERERYLASGDGPYQKLPLVVLVNKQSASASEIVAACLQDHERAKIVGERTFGKGTVQNVIPLEAGKSSLKLTIATYWRPSGKNIHWMKSSKDSDEWGVKPDARCEVKLDPDETNRLLEGRRKRDSTPAEPRPSQSLGGTPAESPLDFDPQLQRAIEVLDQELAQPKPENKAA
jgi:carboxyl-terminal processing protease